MTNDRIIELIRAKSIEIQDELLEIRHHLHANPELSFEEYETSKFIKNKLNEYGISYTDQWVNTGIVAEVKGELQGVHRSIRADIDALPITEESEAHYKSKNEGVMHACGHDVHTTCVLGAAIVLQSIKKQLKGTVKFVFQPGEEQLPGGASLMLKENALGKVLPDYIIGQHVHPPLAAGKVGLRPGQYMASADEIFLNVKGKGGHGALPHKTIDPILTSAYILTAVQSVISRRANPTTPSVLTFGKINSQGGATNVIPEEVHLQGTFRTFDEEWRMRAHKLIRQVVEETAKAHGAEVDLNIKVGYPSLYNHIELTQNVKRLMIEYCGEDNVVDLPIRMTAEDFAYYSQAMPGTFYRLGTGNVGKGITSSVHTPTFDIDESALVLGTGLMAFLAFQEIQLTS